MAYYKFTEIRSYQEAGQDQKDWHVERYTDEEKTQLESVTEMVTCGADIDNPAKVMSEVDNSVTPEESPPYEVLRKQAYPSIEEQLDMQYWDSVNGTNTWKDAIAKVKKDISKE